MGNFPIREFLIVRKFCNFGLIKLECFLKIIVKFQTLSNCNNCIIFKCLCFTKFVHSFSNSKLFHNFDHFQAEIIHFEMYNLDYFV